MYLLKPISKNWDNMCIVFYQDVEAVPVSMVAV